MWRSRRGVDLLPLSLTVVLAKPAVLVLTRLTLGFLFTWAAIGKISALGTFFEEVERYRILPAAWVPVFAVPLVCTELGTGIMVLMGIAMRTAARLMISMLVVFVLALSQALVRHLDLTCGCFGGAEPASIWTVGRDIMLLLACIPLLGKGAETASLRAVLFPKRATGPCHSVPGSGPRGGKPHSDVPCAPSGAS